MPSKSDKDVAFLVELGTLIITAWLDAKGRSPGKQPKLKTISNRKFYSEKAKSVARKILK